MLSEIVKVFENQFSNPQEAIIGGYMPDEGTYIIVEEDQNKNLQETLRVDITINKKTKEVDRTIERFRDICIYDYNSKLIDMNKPIDPKKIIQSNNYLSFIIKKESLINGKLKKENIDTYFKILENPLIKYEKKPKAKELYLEVLKEVGEVDKDKLFKVKEWVDNNIFDLNIDSSKKNYLKVFFVFDKDDFERESKRYLMPNLYNKNDYNIKTKNGILGLPNDNMGLNDKKPYLQNKTRKVQVPFLINKKDVLLQKQFFDYLYNLSSQGLRNIYISDEIVALKEGEKPKDKFNGYYLRIKKGKEAEIIDFDIVSSFENKLKKPFNFKNILEINYDILYGDRNKINFEYGVISNLSKIENLLNEVMFNKFLSTNYFSEELSINDSSLKFCIQTSRQKLHGWFFKGNSENIWPILNKVSGIMLNKAIKQGYFRNAMNIFNLRYSLKEYFVGGDISMADVIKNIKFNLKDKVLNNDDFSIKDDKEYSYAVGQVASFLLNKYKGKNKPLSLINPILNCKSDKKLKDKIRNLFKKFNYDLDSTDIRFKKLYTLVLSYEVEEKIHEDFIIAGYLSNNVIFEKKEN